MSAVCLAGLVPAQAKQAIYDPALADQLPAARLGDTIPADPEQRRIWARHLAFDATLYGQSAVLIYRQAYQQAIDQQSPKFVGFNRFRHGRVLAGPDYAPFKTPNADTLYSNAYLDLRSGPLLFDVPNTGERYFTANFLDHFGNATNISARTHGTKGGRFLIATTDWQGPVPEGRTLFRVASPMMWILLRVLVKDDADASRATKLQDQFMLAPSRAESPETAWANGHDTSAAGFFRILDSVLRTGGVPIQEAALVHRFEAIGIGGTRTIAEALADPPTREGIEAGHADALRLIQSSIVQNGRRVGSWSEPLDVGRYGQNYLYRASINTLGTGANVVEENYPFTSFHDGDGNRLEGRNGPYVLRFAKPPPARFFWSVTVYDANTRTLFANSARKYTVGDRTPGLRRETDGSVNLRFSASASAKRSDPNTLPVPQGGFYVVIRTQGPMADMLERRWLPPPIRKSAP